jgi:glycosyltransferase involved in cell wall biosynthesis
MMLLKLLERLDKRFSPHVISLTTLGEVGPRIQALGIPIEAMGMRPGLPNPVIFFRLIRRLKAIRADAVSTWMYHADLLGGLAARLAGIRGIGWCIRNSDLNRTHTKLATRWVVAGCAKVSSWVPSRILSCSEVARQVHVACGYAAHKMTVIPNGFDLTHYRPDPSARTAIRSELGLPADTPLVGLVGRFDPQKNHVGFFEAAGVLHRRLPAARFVLAGNGLIQSNEALTLASAAAGVGAATHLLGLRHDVPRLMAALDVFVSSSSYGEAFPNVVGEAMASGVTCVVTSVGDSAYIVGDTGRVVAPDDMGGLGTAMHELLALPAHQRQAMGARARARINDNFEIGKVVKLYEDFFDELIVSGQRGNGGG